MKLRIFAAVLVAALFLPSSLLAQESSVTGTITDATNAVLPGVTVTALKLDNGNTFIDVSDASGNYRLALRPGVYKITADLTGFTPAVRDNVEMQIGQASVINLQLKLSTVTETVTVTGQAATIETTQSKIGGVLDSRQVQELPVNGRNFVDLSMMAPGSKQNAVSESATPRNGIGGDSQVNVDGQQVTQMTCCQDSFGNPRYSKDSIAEFEVVTTRFDATQGHSTGAQLNAITKSGTNRFSGSVGGFFRSDKFNAADKVVKRVLPYQDQQVSFTFGGPLVKNKLHFFANYEGERTPTTFVFTTPYASFNKEDIQGTEALYTSGVKFDYQVNPATHAMFKLYRFHRDIPILTAGGSNQTISTANSAEKSSDSLFGSLTQTFGSRAVNEVKGGYVGYFSFTAAYVEKDKFDGLKGGDWDYKGAPRLDLNGISFGGPANLPQRWLDSSWQIRDDLTMLFSKAGRHEVKMGGEYLHHNINLIWMQTTRGILTANNGPIPANIEQIIPNQYDWHTWNIAALSPLAVRWSQAFGTHFIDEPSDVWSGWVQENWTVNPHLTLNLGLRYEIAPKMLNEDQTLPPFLPTPRDSVKNDFLPRLGANYNLNGGKTSFRGGFGRYIAQNDARTQWGYDISIITRIPTTPNDGRPDFASNPYNGKPPTIADVFSRGGDLVSSIPSPDMRLNSSRQGSVGLQHQLNETMSFAADYVYQGSRNEWNTRNFNLTYDPVTGINYPFTDVAHRRIPDWGIAGMYYSDGTSDLHSLQTSFTKRFANHWQASATYTFSKVWDMTPCPAVNSLNAYDGVAQVNCPLYIGNYRSLATTDQRHRATVNGIWELPYGVQLSGLYFFGSGARFATVYGGDRTLMGAGAQGLLGAGGLIAPRNNFVGNPLHRVDLRLQKRLKVGGRMQVDGLLELFNAFNHANFGSYTTNLAVPANYGLPQQNTNVAYQPRIMQLGFRVGF